MSDFNQKVEVVQKYYFQKDGVLNQPGYDWIGKPVFGVFPVELNDKLGFANENGNLVIPIIYDKLPHMDGTVCPGNKKFFVLRKNGMFGLLKHDGTIVANFSWDDMKFRYLSQDLLPVAFLEKWGFFNVKTGKLEVEAIYDDVGFFRNGFAPVCKDGKWGMVDATGNLLVSPKYLTYFYFEGNFTIVHYGGTCEEFYESQVIKNSNWKIINKQGYEIVSDCVEISITGFDTFSLTRKENGKKVNTVKQFVTFKDFIVVIENGEYLSQFVEINKDIPEDSCSTEQSGVWKKYYRHANYVGGGNWSAIDYEGNPIELSESDIETVKKSLLQK